MQLGRGIEICHKIVSLPVAVVAALCCRILETRVVYRNANERIILVRSEKILLDWRHIGVRRGGFSESFGRARLIPLLEKMLDASFVSLEGLMLSIVTHNRGGGELGWRRWIQHKAACVLLLLLLLRLHSEGKR
jgi:hypothetical protein